MAQQTTLRDLAKAYANGAMDQNSYRKSRSDFIQKVIDGDIKLPVIDYPPPVLPAADNPDEVTERKASRKASQKPPQKTSPEPVTARPADPDPPRKRSLFLFVSVAAIVLLIAVFVLIMKGGKDSPELQTANNTSLQAGSEAQKLIQSFLQKRSWTASSMNAFLTEWEAFADDEKAAVKNSVVFGQLTNAIYKKLMEEKALSGIGNQKKSLEKQTQLVHFAGAIGIDDPRISMPENSGGQPAGETDIKNGKGSGDLRQTPTNEDTAQAISPTAVENSVQASPTSCHPTLLETDNPYCRDIIRVVNKTAPTMVVVPPGKFMMGGDRTNEQPKHIVNISYPFAMSVHEITYGEFSTFCKATSQDCPPQPWLGDNYPVVNVSWNDARAYARWLTEYTGNTYRLPSEAEWEYAARAGTDTVYPSGNNISRHDAVFSDGINLNAPLPKTDRSIKHNNFRLYHMLGNVREWTLDNWHDNYAADIPADGTPYTDNTQDYKVVRGGAYNDSKVALRFAAREKMVAKSADRYTGFRVVQELVKS